MKYRGVSFAGDLLFGLLLAVLIMGLGAYGVWGTQAKLVSAEPNALCFNLLSVCLDGSCSAIPDGGTWSYSQAQNPSDPAFWIEDVEVTIGSIGPPPAWVGIEHPDLTQVSVWLEGPDGYWVFLYDGSLGVDPGGTFINGTVFDDAATTSILEGVSPYNGHYRPIEPLAAWDGWYMDGGPEDAFTIHIVDAELDGLMGDIVMLSLDACGTITQPPPTPTPTLVPTPTPTPTPICPPLPADGFGVVGGAVASVHRIGEDECFNVWATDNIQSRMLYDFRDGVYDPAITSLWLDIKPGSGGYNMPWAWHADAWSIGPSHSACDFNPTEVESWVTDQWWLDESGIVCMSDVEIIEIAERRPELDSNDNQVIDIVDIAHVAKLFGLSFLDAGYDPQWDVYPDGAIDLLDVTLIAGSWRDQLPADYGLVTDLATVGPQCGTWKLWEYNVDVAPGAGDDGYLYWLEADVGGGSVYGAAVAASMGLTTTLTVRASAEATGIHVRVAGPQAVADRTAYSVGLPACVPGNPVVIRVDGVDPFDPDTMANSTVIDVTEGEQGPPIITESQKVAEGLSDADVVALGLLVVADSAPDAGRLLIPNGEGAPGYQLMQFIGVPDFRFSFTTVYELPPQGLGVFANFLLQTATIPGLMEIWGETKEMIDLETVWKDIQPPQPMGPSFVQWLHGAGIVNPLPAPGRRICTIADYFYNHNLWKTGVDCLRMRVF